MATQHLKFKAEVREQAGKGVARALRRQNRIPAVIYGDGKPPVTISMDANDANVAYNKGHMFTTLADIDASGEKYLTLARDVQLNPVKDFVLHIDFLRVSSKTKINVSVPVHFNNEEEAPYYDENGILNVVRHDVEILCQATNIPEYIEIDLSGLNIGDSVKSSDITWPEGVVPTIEDRDFTIATVTAPKSAEEEEAEAAENEEDIESADEVPTEEEEEGAEGKSSESEETSKEE